ncbi:hypothetical protein [Legionella sp.]|uniref:hypothetical protein n=1 Tax=Legionella sp. TaxID=459 RepID=UPI003C7F8E49
MGKLNSAGMMKIAKAKKKRIAALQSLIAQPFNITNPEQVVAVKEYIDNFEFAANQMYLFQGLSLGLFSWSSSLVIARIVPIPDFANYLLTSLFYFGAAGYILQKFNTTDFYNHLEEMKTIYNWCLKENKEIYSGLNNNDTLDHPEMQRMIELLAPLCSTHFMCVWPKFKDENELKSGLAAVVGVGQKVYTRFFCPVQQPSDKLKALQVKIEKGELTLNTWKGSEKAIRYFATNTNFREMLRAKIRAPLDYIKEVLPEIITSELTGVKLF